MHSKVSSSKMTSETETKSLKKMNDWVSTVVVLTSRENHKKTCERNAFNNIDIMITFNEQWSLESPPGFHSTNV